MKNGPGESHTQHPSHKETHGTKTGRVRYQAQRAAGRFSHSVNLMGNSEKRGRLWRWTGDFPPSLVEVRIHVFAQRIACVIKADLALREVDTDRRARADSR